MKLAIVAEHIDGYKCTWTVTAETLDLSVTGFPITCPNHGKNSACRQASRN